VEYLICLLSDILYKLTDIGLPDTKITVTTAIGRIIDSLIDRLYELAEERDAKNKPAPKTATSGAAAADISSLDLKVRSLRTRLRNAENATESLAKQQKDVEMKIKMNHQEVSRNNQRSNMNVIGH
jgi:chromosome segregation ATPase